MEFGICGLGRMGASLALHAMEEGHRLVGFDEDLGAVQELARQGVEPAESLEDLAASLGTPRIVFLYVPHGRPTQAVVQAIGGILSPGDIVVDGGNSHWAESRRRHVLLAESGIRFLDVGTSGGVSGARHGASFMVGGEREVFEAVSPILRDLAVDAEAVFFVGPPGSGHFVKLIHNAIEFGMIQSIAEGVELLMRSPYKLDLPGLFDHWMHGSVIRSWLVELMGKALGEERAWEELSTHVEDTGEVKWVLDWALAEDIPTPVVSAAQTMLMQYRDLGSPTAKAVALLRNRFGGHPVHRASGWERR
jgi:6-phosphogluconate dehydrogenase